jgi:putative PIN family toxin of toxin-antitoxin system
VRVEASAAVLEKANASPARLGARCVLDTNVVLDLVVFRDPGVELIAMAIRSGVAVPVTSQACLEELRRVLAYPHLNLDGSGRLAAFECFRAQAQLVDVPATPAAKARLPLCTDVDDQKFLELAWHANARCLITKDKALLRLARAVAKLGRFAVLTPETFERYVQTT